MVLQAQDFDFRKDFQYHIKKTSQKINLDGKLDDACWQKAEVGSDFFQKVPFYAEHADPNTEIFLSYDDNFLYVATKCYQTEDVIIQSLKRDEYWNNDGIAIILDTQNSKTNSTIFGTSAEGVQWDALRSETSGVNDDWNNKWSVETHIADTYWSAEFAIPFKILRYNKDEDEWGMNFVRNIMYCNQYHVWTGVPEGFWPVNPAFAGTLKWDNAPSVKKGNYNIIPYVTLGANKVKDEKLNFPFDAGFDARTSITSTLNLDLTVNPDFSQIEADELVTNLTRFNISLPEKRTFFLENADLFGDYGSGNARPFFSRKIGLDEDLNPLSILYGLRLTGNVAKNSRIGFLNIHSLSSEESLGQNQSAFTVKQQFGRSFVQAMFLNRQAYDGSKSVAQDFGRNLSIESLFLSENGKNTVWLGAHQSFKAGYNDKQGMYNFGGQWRSANWEGLTDFLFFQENYFADMGFTARIENYDAERDTVLRVGYNQSFSYLEHKIRPQEGPIATHSFGIENLTVLNDDYSFNEQYNRLRYFLSLKSNEEFRIRINYNDLNLLFPFSFTGETPLPSDRYNNFDINLEFESDNRKAFSFDLLAQTGGFYNGRLTKFAANANYRIQPWGNFSIGYQWNDIVFPDPYGSAKITALSSKLEIGFNKNLLWTTLFQYVDQSDFVGINSRLQWRYAPMSDLYLVFLDNYDIILNPLDQRKLENNNKALVLKLSYWY